MKFSPHNYQRFAIDYILEHPQAAIFLGCGMGKTIITLTAINQLIYDCFTVRRVLIVAPLRVARDTWPAELKKWDHLTGLSMAVCVGPPKAREAALAAGADITVINRENIPWLVERCGKDWPFDMVVIDELSSFKSNTAQRFKALKAVRPRINRIVGLTGTPAPNSLEDLWAPFRLLDQGERLGKYITHYRQRYFEPDKRGGHIVYSWRLKKGAEDAIYERIGDMTVSMKTTDHLNLPPLTTTTRRVHLDAKERKHYDRLKRDMVTEIGDDIIDAGSAAVLSGKLMQLASGSIYTDDEQNYVTVHDKKLDALEDIIEAANGHTVLVAFWYKHELERLRKRFPDGRYLDTDKDMSDWNDGNIPVAFLHPASAGHGLNLQDGGHILVWLTTPWSLELVEQTNARLFRQGQKEPVSIIHIVASGTIDDRVLSALEAKDTTQASLIHAVRAVLKQ